MPWEYVLTLSPAASAMPARSIAASMSRCGQRRPGAGQHAKVGPAGEPRVERRLLDHGTDPGKTRIGPPPFSRATPLVGRTNPSSIRSVVVLPAPFGPRNPKVSPGRDGQIERVDGNRVAEPLRQVTAGHGLGPLPLADVGWEAASHGSSAYGGPRHADIGDVPEGHPIPTPKHRAPITPGDGPAAVAARRALRGGPDRLWRVFAGRRRVRDGRRPAARGPWPAPPPDGSPAPPPRYSSGAATRMIGSGTRPYRRLSSASSTSACRR